MLGILGKWSRLDVFVAAILIVLVKLGPSATGPARVAAAIFLSTIPSMYVDSRARKQRGAVGVP